MLASFLRKLRVWKRHVNKRKTLKAYVYQITLMRSQKVSTVNFIYLTHAVMKYSIIYGIICASVNDLNFLCIETVAPPR